MLNLLIIIRITIKIGFSLLAFDGIPGKMSKKFLNQLYFKIR